MAGSIAHSALVSLLPILILVLVITAAVGSGTLNEQIVELSKQHLSPTGEGLVYSALTNASERAGASLLGVVSLLWGTLRVFRGLNTAFDELYGGGQTGFLRQLLHVFTIFFAIFVAIVGTALGAALLAIEEHPLEQILNPLLLFVGLLVAFFPVYYLFPKPDLGYREAIPGTIVAAIGWILLEIVFGLYVDFANTTSAYGLLGSVILLLIWLYGISFVLLVGTTVNVVLAGRHRDDSQPESVVEFDRWTDAFTK